jgi:hypothetical protein
MPTVATVLLALIAVAICLFMSAEERDEEKSQPEQAQAKR